MDMDIKCKCGTSYSIGHNGEMFCINPRCGMFMVDFQTNTKVVDSRYDVIHLPESDPKKLKRITELLETEQFENHIAAIRMLGFMYSNSDAIDTLNKYLIKGSIRDSTISLAVNTLVYIAGVKGLAGLRAGLYQLEKRLQQLNEDKGANIDVDTDELRDLYTRDIANLKNIINEYETPSSNLIEAVKKYDTDSVQYMLQKGANPNELGANSATPLHWAAWQARREIIDILLTYGANIHLKDSYGATPIDIAVSRGFEVVVEMLTKHKHVTKEEGSYELLVDAVSKGDLNTVKKYLASGINPNTIVWEQDGWTLMHEAVVHDVSIVRALHDHGANINAATDKGYTPLMRAAGLGHFEVVKYLVEKGANIKAKDFKELTAIDMAIISRKNEIANYLEKCANKY